MLCGMWNANVAEGVYQLARLERDEREYNIVLRREKQFLAFLFSSSCGCHVLLSPREQQEYALYTVQLSAVHYVTEPPGVRPHLISG